MKQVILIIACCLLAAGLCLSQSDIAAAKPDSVKVSVEVQNADSDAATVTVTTEKNTTDTTVTVSINSEPRHGKRPRWRRNWALGVRAYTLSGLPGRIFVQKEVTTKLVVGCGFNYQRNPSTSDLDIPGVGQYNRDDHYGSGDERNSYSSWSIGVSPECIVPLFTLRGQRISTGLSGEYTYYDIRGSNYSSRFSATDTTFSSISGKASCHVFSLAMPAIVEHRFRARKQAFSIGLQSTILTIRYSRKIIEYERINHLYDGSTETTHSGYVMNYPVRIVFQNPFQSDVSLLLKWYF